MKPHVSGESSNLAKESSRSVGEKLHQVCKAAMVAIITDGSNQPSSSSRLLTNQRLSLQSEDPIRTLMFLCTFIIKLVQSESETLAAGSFDSFCHWN
ncbi:hypothetical protein JHK86_008130 [Glycine max]|nr:hypothetical protein JHK86_008130 [Glycine max]